MTSLHVKAGLVTIVYLASCIKLSLVLYGNCELFAVELIILAT